MAVDEDDGLSQLAAPEQALAQGGGCVVLADVGLGVALAGFAEKEAITLRAKVSRGSNEETLDGAPVGVSGTDRLTWQS
jgi:hypothetical protein